MVGRKEWELQPGFHWPLSQKKILVCVCVLLVSGQHGCAHEVYNNKMEGDYHWDGLLMDHSD